MKKALIILNLILTLLVVWSVSGLTGKSQNIVVKSKKIIRQPKNNNGKNSDTAKVKVDLPEPHIAAEKISSMDVFNQIRSPFANTRMGRNDITLLGTFKAGKIEGAIIRQRTNNRQINPYLMQAMRIAGNNRGGMWRGGMQRQMSALTQPLKHYVRVGETLSNGYTLIEVSRTRAVLVRGNDKLELELQDPSKNRSAIATRRQARPNANQQFMQAQMFMQGQMMRTMQQMQRNMNNNSGGNRSGGRGRR